MGNILPGPHIRKRYVKYVKKMIEKNKTDHPVRVYTHTYTHRKVRVTFSCRQGTPTDVLRTHGVYYFTQAFTCVRVVYRRENKKKKIIILRRPVMLRRRCAAGGTTRRVKRTDRKYYSFKTRQRILLLLLYIYDIFYAYFIDTLEKHRGPAFFYSIFFYNTNAEILFRDGGLADNCFFFFQ